ncbi:MAG: PASTA domain-containing protein, partial [Oscillospiraceae bacterium]
TKEEATKILSEQELKIKYKGDTDLVVDQIPKAHTKLAVGSAVVAYTEGESANRSIEVPKVVGESVANASAAITSEGLNAKINGVANSGSASCSAQSPKAGTMVEPGTVIVLDFQYSDAKD